MIQDGTVITTTGKEIALKADTVCIHGDGITALDFAKNIREKLQQENILVTAEF